MNTPFHWQKTIFLNYMSDVKKLLSFTFSLNEKSFLFNNHSRIMES
uniref:Uncharacterized protein n=1 Tax=Anguilla anguilla TaxID=7936 RepID=A0A0E9R8W2_ANGAN